MLLTEKSEEQNKKKWYVSAKETTKWKLNVCRLIAVWPNTCIRSAFRAPFRARGRWISKYFISAVFHTIYARKFGKIFGSQHFVFLLLKRKIILPLSPPKTCNSASSMFINSSIWQTTNSYTLSFFWVRFGLNVKNEIIFKKINKIKNTRNIVFFC